MMNLFKTEIVNAPAGFPSGKTSMVGSAPAIHKETWHKPEVWVIADASGNTKNTKPWEIYTDCTEWRSFWGDKS